MTEYQIKKTVDAGIAEIETMLAEVELETADVQIVMRKTARNGCAYRLVALADGTAMYDWSDTLRNDLAGRRVTFAVTRTGDKGYRNIQAVVAVQELVS